MSKELEPVLFPNTTFTDMREGFEHVARVFEDLGSVLAMIFRDERYCQLSDGSIRRNKAKKPLLHNGGKPR